MTKLYFTLTVQGRRLISSSAQEEQEVSLFAIPTQTAPSSTPEAPQLSDFETLTAPVQAELSIFPDVEAACQMDINAGSNNEIVTVTDAGDAYLLEARRYGHGVGMSQRGAQCMARDYGWTCEQILRFYYPGMTIQKAEVSFAMPTALAADFLATPGPAASPTPRPTLMPVTAALNAGEYRVIVNQIGEGSYLNLRGEANMTSSVLRQLYYGQILTVTGEDGDWLRVKTDDAEGYVMKKFVERVGQ